MPLLRSREASAWYLLIAFSLTASLVGCRHRQATESVFTLADEDALLSRFSLVGKTSFEHYQLSRSKYDSVAFSYEKAYLYGLLAKLAYEPDLKKIKRSLTNSIFAYDSIHAYDQQDDQALLIIKDRSALLVVRGTDKWVDWIHNLNPTPSKFFFNNSLRGFDRSAEKILVWADEVLTKMDESRTFYQMKLVGHSRGGAIAKLIALKLSIKPYLFHMHTYTFAAPRPENILAIKSFKEHERVFNIQLRLDLVPRLPLRLRAFGENLVYSYDEKQATCRKAPSKNPPAHFLKKSHSMDFYLGCLAALLSPSK